MKRFRSLLCVVGHGGNVSSAFHRALSLARTNDARLTIATVLPPPERFALGSLGLGDMPLLPDMEEIREGLRAERARLLDRLAAEARGAGVETGTLTLEGRLFLEVIQEVLRNGHDLVIKTAEGARGPASWLFGSDDHHLMRKCPTPVWLLDEDRDERFRSVLAAVDPTRDGDDPLAVKILELASSLARREGARLHVVHAWSAFEERFLRSHAPELPPHRLDELLRAEKELHRARLEELAERVAPDATLHLRKGAAARIVSLVARETGADVLVMGTLGRSGIPGFLIGNTAEAVLRRVRCGVLTVKPEGFQSPVSLPEGEATAAPDAASAPGGGQPGG